jgi:prepilin-type N-terminal cleavage/methylation domain-containing protein
MTRRAFTLIEVLVALFIIAIIAAVIFPVLTSAKRAALRSPCISNMRQLYTAFTIYCDDAGGVDHPPPTLVELGPLVSDKRLFKCPADHTDRKMANGLYRAIVFYMTGTEPTSPWPISYGYVRDYTPADQQQEWERIQRAPNVGLFACIWHGVNRNSHHIEEKPPFTGLREMLSMDGPSLRICFDGHLYVRQRKYFDGLSIDEVFYLPWERHPFRIDR